VIPTRNRITRSATASRRATPGSSRAVPATRGRPKDSKNLSTLLYEALNEQVVVVENGRRRKVSERQAIIKQLVNRSAQGDLKAMQMLLGTMQDIEHRSEADPTDIIFDASNEKVIEQLKVRLQDDKR
jgi:Family of unknown function (DUF5681)